jgi:hypothetical protein
MGRKAIIARLKAEAKFSYEQAGKMFALGRGALAEIHLEAAENAERGLMSWGVAPVIL